MIITTLTTDCGHSGFEPAALKGCLHSLDKDITIVDITHDVPRNDIIASAYLCRSGARYFPKGSIHVLATGMGMAENRPRILLATLDGQHYIMPDNGLISLLYPEHEMEVKATEDLPDNRLQTWLYAMAEVVKLVVDKRDEGLRKTGSYKQTLPLKPIIREQKVQGGVFYVTDEGNLIVNIRREHFKDMMRHYHHFYITFGGYSTEHLQAGINDVGRGDVACFLNGAGYLEIGINGDSAANLLGLKRASTVMVEWR